MSVNIDSHKYRYTLLFSLQCRRVLDGRNLVHVRIVAATKNACTVG